MKIQHVKLRYLSLYVGFDYLSAAGSWWFFGKIQNFLHYSFIIYPDRLFAWKNIFFTLPIFWICLYVFYNQYTQVLRKSRFDELYNTFKTTFVGSIFVFFWLISRESIILRPILQMLLLMFVHGFFTFIPRYWITQHLVKSFHSLHLQLPSLVIADPKNLFIVEQKLKEEMVSMGNKIVGFISYKPIAVELLKESPFLYLGTLEKLQDIIKTYDIQELILTQENLMATKILEILVLTTEFPYLRVKVAPTSSIGFVDGSQLESVLATPWFFITLRPLNFIQRAFKRFLDIGVSLFALIFGFPVFCLIALLIVLTSKGSIFFAQERIGKLGKPFKIYKFRTMYSDAEKSGPQLSKTADPRITKIGKFLRKTRLDELPQFWNVLIGDMSLVGPRPERQYFIDQITKSVPYYKLLHTIRPGITSLGQIRYGYAENVEQMIERLNYDFIYMQQQSLRLDLKILLYTIRIMLRAQGK